MISMREKRRKLFMSMELEACWNENEWLFKCYECIVSNIPEEYCPPMPLPIPPDYAHNLGMRSKMAITDTLPPPLNMILNTYHLLPSQPPRPSPQCDAPPRRPSYSSRRRSSNVLLPGWPRQRKRWGNDRRKHFVWRNTPRTRWPPS